MKYKVHTNICIDTVEADDIVWGNGVVQFVKKIDENPNAIIKVESKSKPICVYSFDNLIKVSYLYGED